MAILKNHDGNVLKRNFSYWRYAGVIRYVNDLVIRHYDEPQAGVVIKLEGYDSAEHRNLVKLGQASCEFFHEFVICNWIEVTQTTRPATVAEKKAAFAPRIPAEELTDEEWASVKYDIVTDEEIVEHKDLERFMAAVGTNQEAAVAYDIFKTHKFSSDFYEGAEDV